MPTVRIEIVEGRTPERKVELIQRVTGAVVEALAVRPEQVRVLLRYAPVYQLGRALLVRSRVRLWRVPSLLLMLLEKPRQGAQAAPVARRRVRLA